MENRSSERLLNLEGGCNFRDLGGYETADGRSVRWGQVYRSGVLAFCTSGDAATLAKLGVKVICDLRRAKERSAEPTRWPDKKVERLHWDDPLDTSPLRDWRKGYPDTVEGLRTAMLHFYRELPFWLAPRLQGFFARLVSGATPTVVHCSAGKDRTGIAAAALLGALGVSRDVILKDYLLTNEAVNLEKWVITRHSGTLGLAAKPHYLLRLTPQVRAAVLVADADYLITALEEIDKRCGSFAAYLETFVGVGPKQREMLATRLLSR